MLTLKVVVLVGAVMEDTCYSYLSFLKFSGLVQKRDCKANYISGDSYFFSRTGRTFCAFNCFFLCSYISAR
jgi:hypothetical protein